jgi:PAS domain-containing protein
MERHKDLPNFDSAEDAATDLGQLRTQNLATETIDLSSLFTPDVYSSGSFDLSSVASTSFGRLLDALPLPALLIDRWHCVGFANQSCIKVSLDFTKILGTPFLDLLSRPREMDKAQELADKTQALLEKAFAIRKPQTAEAILEMGNKRIWARLHLRSVRIGLERHLLVLIEDVTHEKRQLALNRRQNAEFRRIRNELEAHVQVYRSELATTSERLTAAMNDHVQSRKALQREQRKVEIVCGCANLATAVLASAGTFQEISPKFQELFGFDVEEIPNFRDWVTSMAPEPALGPGAVSAWLDSLCRTDEGRPSPTMGAVACRNGRKKQICFGVARLDEGAYFMTCREVAKPSLQSEQTESCIPPEPTGDQPLQAC